MHPFARVALSGVLVAACSGGNQTLYIASDRPEPLVVTINGKKREMPTTTFQEYGDVKLTKGAEIVIESGGVTIDRATLAPIEEGQAALYLVGGAPSFELADYRQMTTVTDGKGRGVDNGRPGWGPVGRSEIDLVPIDRAAKTVTFDRRAVVAGPDAPFPKGGQVNQLTYEKFPVYRLERVPAGSDPFGVIAPRVTRELGRDRLPGMRGR